MSEHYGYGPDNGQPPPYGQPQYGQPQYGQPQYGAPYQQQAPWGAQQDVYAQQPPAAGYGVPGYGYTAYPGQTAPGNGLGVAGFVTGLIGFLACWLPFVGLVTSGVGVALSGVGMSQSKRTGANPGLAIAGLVCGVVGVIIGLVVTAAFASYDGF